MANAVESHEGYILGESGNIDQNVSDAASTVCLLVCLPGLLAAVTVRKVTQGINMGRK
jgi:hypothetical protein